MKRILSLLLALVLALGLAACGNAGETPASQTPAPATEQPTAQPEPSPEAPPASPAEPTPEPTPTPPPFQTYVYEEGGLTIGVPWSLPAEPEKTDKGIVFADPEGEWTVRFEPLSVKDTPYRVNNTIADVQRMIGFDYYQDVRIEEIDLAGYAAKRLSFSRNPDWVEASMSYTALDYTEAHCILLVDYTDVVVASFGGMLIDVSAPEKTKSDIRPILEDPDVQTLLENLEFAAPETEKTASIPGITLKVPIRWDVADNGETTLWASFQGEPDVTIFFLGSIYKDPQEAASVIGGEVRTLDIGGRTWYAGVNRSELSGNVSYELKLLTDFTQYHALEVKVSLHKADEAGHWAFAESDTLRGILESLELDPEAYHDPEKDRMDTSGFAFANSDRGYLIDAYTGTDTDIIIPAVIGETQLVGIKTDVFKDNTELKSVIIQEGIRFIEYGAFRNCTALETVVLPSSLVRIGDYAFEGCSSLREVRFSEGLLEIDSYAFHDCSALSDVRLPESFIWAGENAFLGAGDGSGSFIAPATGVFFGRGALAESRFDTVEFGPEAVLSESSILADAIVNRVVIGSGCAELGNYFMRAIVQDGEDSPLFAPLTVELNGVEKIGEEAFSCRKGLTRIDLSGVKEMGRNAFEYTGLVNIVVPESLKEIPEGAFRYCADARSITLEEGVERIATYAFEGCGERPGDGYLYYLTEEEARAYGDKIQPNGSPDFSIAVNIYLPSTLQYVDDCAFYCMSIDGVYMLWCTEPDMLPEFHEDAIYACSVHQIYFTEETINNYGDELDDRVEQISAVGRRAWYYYDAKPYWSAESLD